MKGKLFDLLKLRASYGLSGNDDIGNYTAQQTYISQNFLGCRVWSGQALEITSFNGRK